MEKTIKDRLLERLSDAKEAIGPDWRQKIAGADPHYNTFEGAKVLNRKVETLSVDALERITVAAERLAGFTIEPVV